MERGPFPFWRLMGIHRPFRARRPRVIEISAAPRCFDSQERWKLWWEASNACAHKENAMQRACTDCNPKYQEQMILAGRCEHPETKFRYDDEDGFSGYWPKVEAA